MILNVGDFAIMFFSLRFSSSPVLLSLQFRPSIFSCVFFNFFRSGSFLSHNFHTKNLSFSAKIENAVSMDATSEECRYSEPWKERHHWRRVGRRPALHCSEASEQKVAPGPNLIGLCPNVWPQHTKQIKLLCGPSLDFLSSGPELQFVRFPESSRQRYLQSRKGNWWASIADELKNFSFDS